MTKYFLNKIFLGLGFSLLILSSCKKNNIVTDQDPLNVPAYAKFNTYLAADTVVTYYIKSTNDPLKIPVGVTNVSNQDRTVNFTYTSNSAVQGTQYNAPASLVIPAGKALDSLSIEGLFAGFPLSSRIDTVLVTITDGEDIAASPYKKRFRIYMRKYCNVVLNDLLGDYTMSVDRQGTGAFTPAYTATITSLTPTGPTSATAVIYNFGDPMFGAPYNPGDLAITPGITVNLDWANPAAFKATFPAAGQAISVSYYGPTGLVKPPSAAATPGTFSSCDQTFTLTYSFAIGATSYGNFTTILKR